MKTIVIAPTTTKPIRWTVSVDGEPKAEYASVETAIKQVNKQATEAGIGYSVTVEEPKDTRPMKTWVLWEHTSVKQKVRDSWSRKEFWRTRYINQWVADFEARSINEALQAAYIMVASACPCFAAPKIIDKKTGEIVMGDRIFTVEIPRVNVEYEGRPMPEDKEEIAI